MHREDKKLCLKWNDFQENAISAFGTLREDREFADVTLACEDGQQMEAHKIILASSSPFFLNLLRRNKHPHTLIYMRGIRSEDLVAMIDFLYLGEANVFQENLDSFLSVANELQLKGLMGSGVEKEKEKETLDNKPTIQTKAPELPQQKSYTQEEFIAPDIKSYRDEDETFSSPQEGTLAVADLQDLDDKIKSMMEVSEKRVLSQPSKKIYTCTVCGKNLYKPRNGLRKHKCKESNI